MVILASLGVLVAACGGSSPSPTVVTPAASPAASTVTATPVATSAPFQPILGPDGKEIEPRLPPVSSTVAAAAAPLSLQQYQQQLIPFGWSQIEAKNADVTGDGQPEALLTGASGIHGRGVFVMEGSAVIFDVIGDNSQIAATADHKGLEITQPLRLPGEPFAGASWSYVETYNWNGTGFTLADMVSTLSSAEINNQAPTANQPSSQVASVALFYTLLSLKQFPQAYALLSPNVQNAEPYPVWLAGYANLRSVYIESIADSRYSAVAVKFKATDSVPDGSTTTTEFDGTWQVVTGSAVNILTAPSLKKTSP